jgi:hypothetical protein
MLIWTRFLKRVWIWDWTEKSGAGARAEEEPQAPERGADAVLDAGVTEKTGAGPRAQEALQATGPEAGADLGGAGDLGKSSGGHQAAEAAPLPAPAGEAPSGAPDAGLVPEFSGLLAKMGKILTDGEK